MAAAGSNFDWRSSKECWCGRENAHGCSIIYYSSMLHRHRHGQGNGQAVAVLAVSSLHVACRMSTMSLLNLRRICTRI